MTGCLKIKNDTFYAVLNLKEGGKYKQKWVSTKLKVKGNKYKAMDFLNKLMIEYEEKEAATDPSDILFTDYLIQWLEKKKNKVETVTFEGYKTLIDNHIYPYFGKKKFKLSEIKPSHIADFYESKFKNGRCDGKGGLSIRTIKMLAFIIKAVMDEATFYELILRNPASKVPLPKKEDEEKKCVFLDAKSANEVLKFFRGHHLQPLIYTTLYYGLRRSEVLGLKWDAIDFENDTLEIKHTVVKHTTIVAKDKTKTAAGKRKYTLLSEIKEVLLNLKNESQKNKKIFGKEYQNTE
ncbi:MAG: site-specific integrase [Bacilli bacterium]